MPSFHIILCHKHLQSSCGNGDTPAHARIDFVYITSHRLRAACLWFYGYCVVFLEHSTSLLAHYVRRDHAGINTWVVNRLRSFEPKWLCPWVDCALYRVCDIYADSRVAINERFSEPLRVYIARTVRTATIGIVRSCQHCKLSKTLSYDLIVFPTWVF